MKAELLILGALHRGAMHPYEIRRRFRSALVECYTDVDVGTLYYAVRQLAAAGHIEAHKVERVARGGNRTTYRITPRGRARFQELLNEQFRVEGVGSTSLYSALLFLHLADLPNVAVLLRERLARLEGRNKRRPSNTAWHQALCRHRCAPPDGSPRGAARARSQVAAQTVA